MTSPFGVAVAWYTRGFAVTVGAFACTFVVVVFIAWLDRRTESPIMRTRVNQGSDRYLKGRRSAIGEGLDAVERLEGKMQAPWRHLNDDDDDTE